MAKLLHRFLPASLRRKAALWPHRQATARLESARRAPQDAQRRALVELLRHNAQTEFGRTHGFGRISGLSDYASRVPLRSYHELEPYLRREVDGEPDVLLAGPILGFALDEVSGRRRLLPLSGAGRAHRHWLTDLLLREALLARPEISGLSWLRLLPRHAAAELEADAIASRAPTLPLQRLLRVDDPAEAGAPPAELFTVDDEALRYYTLLRLGAHQRYGALQAENPGTLTILAEYLEQLADELLDELSGGTFGRRDELPEAVQLQLPKRFTPRPKQAARLRELRQAQGRLEPAHLWPELRVLLCDVGGPARAAARRLPDRFGDVTIIDSGHANAEAVLTLPTIGDEGSLALLEGQLLEFVPANEHDSEVSGPTLPADGLRLGQRYLPIVSNHHGLYRYALDQLVEVSEIDGGTPRLARIGRRPQRLAVGALTLDELLLRDAVLAACRSSDLVLVGVSAWLQPAATTEEAPADSTARPGFWQRLFGRGKEAATNRRRRPALAWAVELGETLDDDGAKKLRKAVEAELAKACEPYARLRSEKGLDAGSLLLLRSGTFTREARRTLADGLPSGHLPPPALRETPWSLAPDALDRTID